MHSRVLIVAGGASPGSSKLKEWAARYDGIIAADSGLDTLIEAGIEADHVTGDFDSISSEALRQLTPDRKTANPEQDTTDLEKAILMALDLGATVIGLACSTGSRLDHSINAVSMILRYHRQANFVIHDECGEATLLLAPGPKLDDPVGTRISLIPAPEAIEVHTANLRYPLCGIDLRLGGRDGISNEITATPAEIKLSSGALLVYRQSNADG